MLPDSAFEAAISALPENFTTAVYYSDVVGMRYREIAEVMGTTAGTVMSRLRRGRQRLGTLLQRVANHESGRTPRHDTPTARSPTHSLI